MQNTIAKYSNEPKLQQSYTNTKYTQAHAAQGYQGKTHSKLEARQKALHTAKSKSENSHNEVQAQVAAKTQGTRLAHSKVQSNVQRQESTHCRDKAKQPAKTRKQRRTSQPLQTNQVEHFYKMKTEENFSTLTNKQPK